MRTQIQRLLFKDKGFIPYQYHVAWPVNQDDDYVIVFVQEEEGEPWETFALRIELHIA